MAAVVTPRCKACGHQPAGGYPRRFFNEREFRMRLIVFGVCLFAAACSGTDLPFSGSYTSVIEVPPPSAAGTVEGTAAHLGRFTGRLTAEVTGNTATGKFTFIAANGDQLSGTFVGEGVFMPPNTATRNEIATIESGTGRFAGATGTFTMVTVDTIDLATGKATGYGSFEGRINLNK
jgi:hypothetical protein